MSEMTAKKLIDLLKKNGYNEVSIKGDHHKYKRETDGKTFVVPYTSLKSTIAPGTYKAICRQAGNCRLVTWKRGWKKFQSLFL